MKVNTIAQMCCWGVAINVMMTLSVSDLQGQVDVSYPKFGTPVVSGEHVIFSGPGYFSGSVRNERGRYRLICVSRSDGTRLWEIKNDRERLAPVCGLDGTLIMRRGSDLCSCSLKDGTTELLYKSGLDIIRVTPCALPLVLVFGKRGEKYCLALVDLRSRTKKWEIEEFSLVKAVGNDVLLCAQPSRRVGFNKTEGSGRRKTIMLAGVSKTEGRVLWQHAGPEGENIVQGVAVGSYFVVSLKEKLVCFEQKSGLLRKEAVWEGDAGFHPSMCVGGGGILLWAPRNWKASVVYRFSVPEMIGTVVMKPDFRVSRAYAWQSVLIGEELYRVDAYDIRSGKRIWTGGQWNWDGMHDGCIYFSEMEADEEHTSVQRISMLTGERKVLYREELPEDMQGKD